MSETELQMMTRSQAHLLQMVPTTPVRKTTNTLNDPTTPGLFSTPDPHLVCKPQDPNNPSNSLTGTTLFPSSTPSHSSFYVHPNTPYHMTSAAKPCLCGKNVRESNVNGLMHCSVCSTDFHAECVGLKFLTTALNILSTKDNFFDTPEWTCPTCIVRSC